MNLWFLIDVEIDMGYVCLSECVSWEGPETVAPVSASTLSAQILVSKYYSPWKVPELLGEMADSKMGAGRT